MFETWASWLAGGLVLSALIGAILGGKKRLLIAWAALTFSWVASQLATLALADDAPANVFFFLNLITFSVFWLLARSDRSGYAPRWPLICAGLDLAMAPSHFFAHQLGQWYYLNWVNGLFDLQLAIVAFVGLMHFRRRLSRHSHRQSSTDSNGVKFFGLPVLPPNWQTRSPIIIYFNKWLESRHTSKTQAQKDTETTDKF